MQVVIRSDPHQKVNEYMEKYSYLSTKRNASWQLRAAFCSACARIQQDARTSFAVINLR